MSLFEAQPQVRVSKAAEHWLFWLPRLPGVLVPHVPYARHSLVLQHHCVDAWLAHPSVKAPRVQVFN